MANPPKNKKAKTELARGKSTVADAAMDLLDKTAVPSQQSKEDPSAIMSSIVDLMRTKATIKGTELLTNMMDKELKEDTETEKEEKPVLGRPSQKTEIDNPVVNMLALLPPDQRFQMAELLMKDMSQEALYDLMAGKNPTSKPLLSISQGSHGQPSQGDELLKLAQAANIGTLSGVAKEASATDNILKTLQIMKELQPQNNGNDDVLRGLNAMGQAFQTGMQALMQQMMQQNQVIAEAIKSMGSGSGDKQLQMMQEFMARMSEMQQVHAAQQLESQQQMSQMREQSQAQVINSLVSQINEMKSALANNHQNASALQQVQQTIQQMKQFADAGIVQKTQQDIEIEKLRLQNELEKSKGAQEIEKLRVMHELESRSKQAREQNLNSMVSLASQLIPAVLSKPAKGDQPELPSSPSPAAAKLAGVAAKPIKMAV